MSEDTSGEPATSVFVHRPGDAWEAAAELAVAAVLVVSLHPAGGYRWSPIVSSDGAVAEVFGTVGDDGAARFRVLGKSAGSAVLSATTKHLGDRFGPPTRRWVLRLRVLGEE